MSREIRGSHPDYEINENHTESKETTESNLSIVLARELVEKVNAREELDLNDYQRSCKYAMVCTKGGDLELPWFIGDLEGFLKFYRELPNAISQTGETNTQVLFCGSKNDVRLIDEEFRGDKGIDAKLYRTPDGVVYRKIVMNARHNGQPLFQLVERNSYLP